MIKDLETEIGYHFYNISLLQNALTHSSYANERWHNSLLSNERLEFLGDSILGMLVADYLYRNFPDRPEGELTRMRADMVCETTLAGVAEKIHLGDHLLLGRGAGRRPDPGVHSGRCRGIRHRRVFPGWRHGGGTALRQDLHPGAGAREAAAQCGL